MMQLEPEIELNSSSAYPGLRNPKGSLLSHARAAVTRVDIDECCRIVAWAIEHPSRQSSAALEVLASKPHSGRARRASNRQIWTDMRVSAIQALQRSASPRAVHALAGALMHEQAGARDFARAALEKIGVDAVQPLVDSVQTLHDWPLKGVLETIETVGRLKQPVACSALTRVLCGRLPVTPDRWVRCVFGWSVGLGSIVSFSVVALQSTMQTPIDGEAIPGLVLEVGSAAILALLLSGICSIPVGLIVSRLMKRESAELYEAAADALINIKSPRCAANLIGVATGSFPVAARRSACRALVEILPSLNETHLGLLDGGMERSLTSLMHVNYGSLTLSIVRALEFVGTGQSAAALERMVRRNLPAHAGPALTLAHSEAERVLPMLQERLRQEQATSMLLRPSQAGEMSREGLLRPASAYDASETVAEELLRPGISL